jgi:hypothetical protein
MAGFIDQVAIRKDLVDSSVRFNKRGPAAYTTMWSTDDAFIHPTSVIYSTRPAPEMIIYSDLTRTTKVWLTGKYWSIKL